MNLEGGCACRAVRYRLTESPLIVHACHCRDCQRLTGGPFVINIWIEGKFVEPGPLAPRSFRLAGAAESIITMCSSARFAARLCGAAITSCPATGCSCAPGHSIPPKRSGRTFTSTHAVSYPGWPCLTAFPHLNRSTRSTTSGQPRAKIGCAATAVVKPDAVALYLVHGRICRGPKQRKSRFINRNRSAI
jgi:hypothetical protein